MAMNNFNSIVSQDIPLPSKYSLLFRPLRVMLVNDQPAMFDLLRRVLESYQNEIHIVDNMADAFGLMQTLDPDLVFVCAAHDGVNPKEFLVELPRNAVRRVPCIIMADEGIAVDVDAARLADSCVYLPFDLDDVREIVDMLLDVSKDLREIDERATPSLPPAWEFKAADGPTALAPRIMDERVGIETNDDGNIIGRLIDHLSRKWVYHFIGPAIPATARKMR